MRYVIPIVVMFFISFGIVASSEMHMPNASKVLREYSKGNPNSLTGFIVRHESSNGLKPVYLSYGLTEGEVEALLKIRNLMVLHEGYKHQVYKDSLGLMTVGVGHLIAPGDSIPTPLVEAILFQDMLEAVLLASKLVDNWHQLSEPRQRVLIDMSFNMGESRIRGFKRMLRAIESNDFAAAAKEMQASKWCEQVKNRCNTLTYIMREGKEKYDLSR